jgi:hypothetical protein
MNYKKIYNSLIERSRHRVLEGYYEKHHIVPRCLGGSDDVENLANLTPEEHYLAHQLLVKIYPDNASLLKAAVMMIPNRPSNKLYGWLRRKFSEVQSTSQTGSSNSQFGTRWVHNPLTKVSKKIRGPIEDGWIAGRYKSEKIKSIVSKSSKRSQRRLEQERIHREYYKVYKEVGFTKFVELTGYKKSKANLVQQFAKLLSEFTPQNGKKRGDIPR